MSDQAQKLRDIAGKQKKMDSGHNLTHKTRIITITSGKGGVGKSNIAVNLGLSLARKKKNIVIFDADFGMANIDIILGEVPRFNLYDVVNGTKNLADIIINGPLDVKIVPGGTGFLELVNLEETKRRQLLSQLIEMETAADILIIDTGAGLSKTVLGFIAAAQEILLVTTPEPTAITDAYGITKIVSRYNLQSQVKLVVNQAVSSKEGREVALRFCRVSEKFLQLKVDYLGYILFDKMVARAVREQYPFILAYPNSKAAGCIDRMTDSLLLNHKDLNLRKSDKRGFFSKISRFFS